MIRMKIMCFLLILAIFASCNNQQESLVLKEDSFGGDFSLESSEGPWSLFGSNGKVRVLYFGFTHCPDICPMSLSKLSLQLKKFTQQELQQILPVFISVDYQRDNAKSCNEYASYFNRDIIGLSGNQEAIEKVTKQYGVYFKFVPLQNSAMGYTVDHSSRFYIIDKKGKYYSSYTEIENNSNFLNDIRKLMN
jgi:protein SCO1/2